MLGYTSYLPATIKCFIDENGKFQVQGSNEDISKQLKDEIESLAYKNNKPPESLEEIYQLLNTYQQTFEQSAEENDTNLHLHINIVSEQEIAFKKLKKELEPHIVAVLDSNQDQPFIEVNL